MNLALDILAAFADSPDRGNPAAVAIVDEWPEEPAMQAIAREAGLSETAFVVVGPQGYEIRWFTPVQEVPLCGHATLAAAAVIRDRLTPDCWPIELQSASGPLMVDQAGARLVLDFPADPGRQTSAPAGLFDALGCAPVPFFKARNFSMVVLDSEAHVLAVRPVFEALAEVNDYAVIVTARGSDADFVSRVFAPSLGIDEDPVTGSAHCVLMPYWSDRLGRPELHARQLSSRGGDLYCVQRNDRVHIGGDVVAIATDVIKVPESSG
jgi:PhzF family phenazine biosynthesis protein